MSLVEGADLLRAGLGLQRHRLGSHDEVANHRLRRPLLVGLHHFRLARTEAPLHPPRIILELEAHTHLDPEHGIVGGGRALEREKLPLVDLAPDLEEVARLHARVDGVVAHLHAAAARVGEPQALPDQFLEEVLPEEAHLVLGELPSRPRLHFLEVGRSQPVPFRLAYRDSVDHSDHGRIGGRRASGGGPGRARRRGRRGRGGRRGGGHEQGRKRQRNQQRCDSKGTMAVDHGAQSLETGGERVHETKKFRPSADGSREVWGAIDREPTVLTEGLHPLGPAELPLERSAVSSHTTAFSPRTHRPRLSAALADAASARALAPSRRA